MTREQIITDATKAIDQLDHWMSQTGQLYAPHIPALAAVRLDYLRFLKEFLEPAETPQT